MTCNEIVRINNGRDYVVCRMEKGTEHTHCPPQKSRKATPSEVTDARIAALSQSEAFAAR